MRKEITKSDIDKLSNMSALEFSDEDKETLITEVQSITTMLSTLQNEEVEQNFLTTQKLEDLRSDSAADGLEPSQVFLNAPKAQGGYFVVPKVVD